MAFTGGSTKEINEDAVKAKSLGLTYGQYKSGYVKLSEDGPYKVAHTDFLTVTENVETKKPVAFIKIK